MKLSDLKNNRAEILERINEIGNTNYAKEIMIAMVNVINAEMNESNNPIDLVDEVIEMNQKWEKQHINTLWGAGTEYSTQAEYQRAKAGY